MAGRLNARRAVAAAAAVLVLSTGVTLVVATAPAGAQIDDWQPCEAAADSGRIERIEIALVIDRSGSLENVDPNGTSRRRALYGTRESLVGLQESVSQLLGESNSGAGLGIDVALVAFDARRGAGAGAETVAGFARVSGEHPSDGAIQAALSSGGDTDYGPAVDEALALFEGSPNAAEATTCRILVMFTDGILDPYDTASGNRPSLERQAESHVANLLDDLCASDPGLRRYRQRLGALGVSSYVAVLANDDFQRGAGSSHLDVLAGASKQMFLALTGHVASPLLRGVSAAAGCESWSAERSGKVVEMEGIGELVGELTDVVGEVGLAVRAPRIRCTPGVVPEVGFAGEWPHGYDISDPAGEPLCVVTPPLDGEMVLRAGGPQLPGGAVWLIGSGAGAEESPRLTAGDEDLLFDVTSSRLPPDEPVGAVDGATIEIAATWYPDPELRGAWPEQPDEVGVASAPLGIELPDREAYRIEQLVDCREHQRARWDNATGGVRATAAALCNVEAPPAGDFEITLVSDDGNQLEWSAVRARADGGLEPVRGETVLLGSGDPTVSIGAMSQILAPNEAPYEQFEDRIEYRLIWRSQRGSILADRSWVVAIAIRPPDPDPPMECDAVAQVTAARQSPGGEWAIVVDTGCSLQSPPQGTNGVTVTGDVQGRVWQLTERPPEGEQSWPTRDSLDLGPREDDRHLFVGVGHPDLENLVGEEFHFILVSTRYDDASSVLREQREIRSVTVYLPIVSCKSGVKAVRVGVEPPGGGESEQLARAESLCTIDRPPNGFLEIRAADAPPGPPLGWQTLVDGDDAEVRIVESGRDPAILDVRSGPLRSDLLGPFDSGIDVYLNWISANGHSSGSGWRGVVAVQEDPPVLLDCSGGSAMSGSGGEVPEGPLAVDTGCVLLAPPAGEVALISVEGSVAGVSWRLPEPVRLTASDDDRRIRIETDGVLPNEPLNRTVTFELVAALTVGDYTPVPDREERNVQVRFQPRIRIRCTEPPAILGNPVEVPEGPLVVDTGCVLQAPAAAGEVTVEVADGEVAGVGWVVRGDVRLEAGDDDVPILIETAGPLPNRRYDAFAEFSLAAIWRSPDGVEQSVGSQPAPGGAPTEVAVALRARPNSGQAALLAVALLVGGLLAGWLLLAGLGQRANRLPSSGAYRLVSGQATATVTPGAGVKLEGFDLAQLLQGKSEPLIRRRGRLRAGDLTIRVQRQWWNPRDLLDGGRAAVTPQVKNALVAAAPSSGRPDSLRPTLAPGAVVVALESAPSVSKQDGDRHRARVWILIPSGGKQASGAQQNAERNLRTARDQLRKRVAPKSATGAGKR
ncbi:MAG: VWA domain-containing protein [bacterium]|nr:VWA domain-containing protein [bacterium]